MKTRLFETFFVECKPLSAGVCWQKPDMLHLLSCPGTLQVRPCCRRVLLAISAVSVEGKSILEWILDTCVCIYTCISCTCLCLGAGMVQKDMLITSSLIYLGWIRDSMVLWLWLGPRASPKKDISFHPMKSWKFFCFPTDDNAHGVNLSWRNPFFGGSNVPPSHKRLIGYGNSGTRRIPVVCALQALRWRRIRSCFGGMVE